MPGRVIRRNLTPPATTRSRAEMPQGAGSGVDEGDNGGEGIMPSEPLDGRCAAMTKAGTPCKRQSATGRAVCASHRGTESDASVAQSGVSIGDQSQHRDSELKTAMPTPDAVTTQANKAGSRTASAAGPTSDQVRSDFCRSCGGMMTGARFCGNCGTSVESPDVASHPGEIEIGTVGPRGRLAVSGKGVALVTLVAVIVVGAVVGGWAVLSRATSSTHTIRGDMSLMDSDSFRGRRTGGACSGSGGYADIDEGTTVSIKNESGTLIGSGSLDAGTIVSDTLGACVFPFNVEGVKDASFFQVEVSHRGGLSYSKKEIEAKSWTVDATLGA